MEEKKLKKIVKVGGFIAAMAIAAWMLSKLVDGADSETIISSKKKMMKAPGRDLFIPRDDFEANPKAYFRGLRGK